MNFVLCQGREGPEEPLEGLGGRTAAEDQVWGGGFGFSRTPVAILEESSLPFHYHLWLINGQSNHKGIRF